MAISYTRNKWKKADVLTADKLNNTEIALEAIVNKINGVSYDENDTPTTLKDAEKIASIQDINDAIDGIPKASTDTYGLVKVGDGLTVSEGTVSLPSTISTNILTALENENSTGSVTTDILYLANESENLLVSLNATELSVLKGIVGDNSSANISASAITTNKLTTASAINTQLFVGIPDEEDPNDPLIVTPGNPIANFSATNNIDFYKSTTIHGLFSATGNITLGSTITVAPTVSEGIVTVPGYDTLVPSSTSTIYSSIINVGLVCREEEVQSNINLYGQIKLVSLDTEDEVTLTANELKQLKALLTN